MMMEAMLQAVGSHGYEAVTIGMVLGRTGSSRRTFDLEFEGKENCFLAAFDCGVEKVEALIREEATGEGSWLGRFRAGLSAMLEFIDNEPDIARALVVEVLRAGPEGRTRANRTMKRAGDFIDLALLESGISHSSPPPKIAPEAIVAGIYGALYSRLAKGVRGGFRELLPGLAYQAVLPYFGREIARREMARASEDVDH